MNYRQFNTAVPDFHDALSGMIIMKNTPCSRVTMLAILVPLSNPTWAKNDNNTSGIETIEVTARRAAESLQTTPISITALNAEALDQKGISGAKDLTGFVPGLQIQANATGSADITMSLRGLRISDTVATNESPIGVYLDGAIQPRISGALMDLLELERVEVLRGPQGSLYGRNSTGGAINFISRKPYQSFGYTQDLTFGSESLLISQTRIDTGNWADTGITAAITYRYANRDGFYDIIQAPSHRDGGAFDDNALRVALNWVLHDSLIADYSYNRIRSEATKPVSHLVAVSYQPGEVTQVGGKPIAFQPNREDTFNLNNNGYGSSDTDLHTLSLSWQLNDNYTLKAITGIRDWHGVEIGNDLDGNGKLQALVFDPVTMGVSLQGFDGMFYSPLNDREQQHSSQELQLLGQLSSDVSFVFGLFYFDEQYSEYNPTRFYLQQSVIGAPFGMLLSNTLDYHGSAKSKAAFSQFNWQVNTDLRLTAGIRYTRDDKYLHQTVMDMTAPTGFISGSDRRDYSNVNWNISADYQFTDTLFGYARVATGYKSGGLTARSAGAGNLYLDDYDEETLIGYEIGLKSDWWDNRLRINTNLFYTRYDDFQIDSFLSGSGGATSIVDNAGKAHQLGAELEFIALLGDNLRLDGNLSWLDMQFDRYAALNRLTDQHVDVASSAEFPYVSDITASLGAQYHLLELWGGDLSIRTDIRYISDRSFSQVNLVPGPTPALNDYHSPFKDDIRADAFTLTDIRLSLDGVTTPVGDLRLSAWLSNAFDTEYITQGIDFGALGFGNVIYGDPRSMGLDLRLQY